MKCVVPVNRIHHIQQVVEKMVALKLRGRMREGQIMDEETMIKMGYDYFLIEKLS